MRVIYIVNNTTPFGGATKSLLTLLKGLIPLGVFPTVVVPDNNGLTQILQKEGIPTIVLQKYNTDVYPSHNTLFECCLFIPYLLLHLIRHRIAYHQLKAICKHLHPDIIHTNTSVNSFGYEVAKHLHIPHIYHFREYGDLDFHLSYTPSWKHFHNTLKVSNSFSICITHDIQVHHELANNPRSFVVYNGIQVVDAALRKGKQDYFLYAGRLEPAKGVLELVNAYLLYRHQSKHPLPLLLIGDVCQPAYYQQIRQLVLQENATEHVQWLGEKTDVASYMQNAKAIIISSPHEGFGRCMPEAMLHGCVAIAIDSGGTKEQLDNGMQLTGKEIAYRYHQENELVAQLLQVETAEEAELDDMRQRAKQTVTQLYNPQQYIQNIWNIYQQIVTF